MKTEIKDMREQEGFEDNVRYYRDHLSEVEQWVKKIQSDKSDVRNAGDLDGILKYIRSIRICLERGDLLLVFSYVGSMDCNINTINKMVS